MHSISKRPASGAVSIAVMLSLVGSTASPLSAQHVLSSAGPSPQAGTEAPSRDSPSRESAGSWADVREIESGQDVFLTLRGSSPARRLFVAADDASIMVLDVTDDRISDQVRSVLIGTAWDRPEQFVLARGGGTSLLDERLDLRLGPAGVTVKGLGILGLDQIIRQIPRPEVATIVTEEKAIARGIGWGALAGGLLGLAMQISYCRENVCYAPALFILPLVTGAGIGIGAGIGAQTHVRTTVYRAP